MSGGKPRRCDACGKRLRPSHHELRLEDLLTGQVLGLYHAGVGWQECMAAARRYMEPGVMLGAAFVHPDLCGPNQESCDAGSTLALGLVG